MALSSLKTCYENLEKVMRSERSRTKGIVYYRIPFIQVNPQKQNPDWGLPETGGLVQEPGRGDGCTTQ